MKKILEIDILPDNYCNFDCVFCPIGGIIINDKFEETVDLIKSHGRKVRLFSNGYMLGVPELMRIANKCDEVTGEVKCTSDDNFQKYQRPVEGYTLDKYIENMVNLQKLFILYNKPV